MERQGEVGSLSDDILQIIKSIEKMKQNIDIAIQKLELLRKEYIFYRDTLIRLDNTLYNWITNNK